MTIGALALIVLSAAGRWQLLYRAADDGPLFALPVVLGFVCSDFCRRNQKYSAPDEAELSGTGSNHSRAKCNLAGCRLNRFR